MGNRYLYIGIFAVIVAALAWAVASSWENKERTPIDTSWVDEEKIVVVTSLFPWYDLAREIGGNRVSASLLLPPGIEAHAFEPTPSDMITLGEAKLFLYTGDYLEPWAGDLIRSLEDKAPQAVALGEGYATLKDEDEEMGLDPHIWLDPTIMEKAAGRLALALGEIDPDNKAYYNGRWEAYQERLEKLDDDYRQALSRCRQKEFIYAGHFAFGYLAARYGLDHEAAQGFSPDAESSPARLAELSDLLRARGAGYLFTEATDSPRLAQALAEESGTEILTLDSAHNPTKDRLRSGLTYEQIMRENLDKLIIGLKCR